MLRDDASEFVYLNNAATSWPKPPQVLNAVQESLISPFVGGGRSSGSDAQDYIWDARTAVAGLLGVCDEERVLFSHNATDALNTLIHGFLSAHSGPVHVISSVLEHNSVLRPLWELKQAGRIELTLLPMKGAYLDLDTVSDSVRSETKLAVLNHGSNVLGSVQDLDRAGKILHESGVYVIADGAQTAGHVPLVFDQLAIDAYAFTGHKALFGIPGTGGFIIKDPEEITPIRYGGTGSNSVSLNHPRDLPERFEAGTHNFPGLAALTAGIDFIQTTGQKSIEEKGIRQSRMMIDGLKAEPNITIYNETPDLPIISLNIDGLDNEDLGFILTRAYRIITRSGLHCAPLVHKETDGGRGSVRLSLSWFTTDEECIRAVQVIREVARSANSQISQA
ncbi:MAG: aminotransferase class V-fold PLP-dependent enzyme [Methanospirillum sp.]|uniref:aminotransferase class V-fold PLP-dependent enzyme n=1 Tax=Methanospirillum sp. TaxID=45200 RepID=UPI00236AFAD6|nr:aminotransferase class V-fold PLP-dependent enzyme [Methanospirillum sp.]MDD1728331.1 aminotransferase class V-fold PLP-dependent enzyme [Methanospirillum sp.]